MLLYPNIGSVEENINNISTVPACNSDNPVRHQSLAASFLCGYPIMIQYIIYITTQKITLRLA